MGEERAWRDFSLKIFPDSQFCDMMYGIKNLTGEKK